MRWYVLFVLGGKETEVREILNDEYAQARAFIPMIEIVQRKKGESPVHCNGKVLIIDGGFSKAYQNQTGIAGYTLVYNSHGLILASHEPFESMEAAIRNESDIHSESVVLESVARRQLVADTDAGQDIALRIYELEKLLGAYRTGLISEKG